MFSVRQIDFDHLDHDLISFTTFLNECAKLEGFSDILKGLEQLPTKFLSYSIRRNYHCVPEVEEPKASELFDVANQGNFAIFS